MKRSDARKRDSLMEKSKMWYETAAKQGHVPSKVGFAKMCLEDPTNDNVQQALKIYEEADTAGNVDATYNLGFVIPLDFHDSLDLLRGSVRRRCRTWRRRETAATARRCCTCTRCTRTARRWRRTFAKHRII